jgi:hypothetical protein
VGTSVSLVCLVEIAVDRTLVDTNTTVSIAFDGLPSDATRVNMTSTMANGTMAFRRIAHFKFLLPSDEGVVYGCKATLRTVENSQFVEPTVHPTVNRTLHDIAGKVKHHGWPYLYCLFLQICLLLLLSLMYNRL